MATRPELTDADVLEMDRLAARMDWGWLRACKSETSRVNVQTTLTRIAFWQHQRGLRADGLPGPETFQVALGSSDFAALLGLASELRAELERAELCTSHTYRTLTSWLAMAERQKRR